jgi:hypothetical protein
VIGIPAAFLAALFLAVVHDLEHWLWDSLPSALGHSAPPWYLVLLLPPAGACVVLLARRLLPGDGGRPPLEGIGGGATPESHAPGIALAAIGTLSFGAVLGPEAPLIALGSVVGMVVALSGAFGQREQTVLATAGSFLRDLGALRRPDRGRDDDGRERRRDGLGAPPGGDPGLRRRDRLRDLRRVRDLGRPPRAEPGRPRPAAVQRDGTSTTSASRSPSSPMCGSTSPRPSPSPWAPPRGWPPARASSSPRRCSLLLVGTAGLDAVPAAVLAACAAWMTAQALDRRMAAGQAPEAGLPVAEPG